MDPLGRFYTQDLFSNLLIQNIENEDPKKILELGVGGGALLRAAYNRWAGAEYIAADIDPCSVDQVSKDMPFVKLYNVNSLSENIEKSLFINKSTIDIAICNPPYLLMKDKKLYDDLFIETKLGLLLKLNKVTSDLVFLAQNFKMLKAGGELGIILPDNILTGKDFQMVRKALLENHKIKAIIELPDRIFPKTEAKTHILVIEKEGVNNHDVPLFIAGKDGVCYDQIEIKMNDLVDRMDFSFHKVNRSRPFFSKLKSYPHELKRGIDGNKELKDKEIVHLHSTSFKNGERLKLANKKQNENKHIWAKTGDILIVRVGRGCVGKCAIVESGTLPISDCLYMIRVEESLRKRIWKFITSDAGREWLKAYSHGVCSKVLSRVDILDLPILD